MPTISINLTAEQAARLQEAWRVQFRSPPNMASVKARLIADLKLIVANGERKMARRDMEAAAVAVPPEFDPT